MRTISTVSQHHHRRGRLLSLVVMSIAIGLVAIVQGPSRAGAKVVTPLVTAPMLTGTLAPVNNGPGDQTNPHVSRDRVSYTNDDFADFVPAVN